MDIQKVDLYLTANKKFFPADKIMVIREKLLAADEHKMMQLSVVEFKDPTTMLIVSVCVGVFGIDRFLLGEIGMGVLKLLTGGVFGILAILDWFTIQNKTKSYNLKKFLETI